MTIQLLTKSNEPDNNESTTDPFILSLYKEVQENISSRQNQFQGKLPSGVQQDKPFLFSDKPGWGVLPKERIYSDYSKQRVKELASTLQAMGKRQISLLTITAPCGSDAAKMVLVSQSSYITNRLSTAILDRLDGFAEKSYFYVKEFTKNGGLHWHYAVFVPKEAQSLFTTKWLQKIVYRSLKKVSSRSGFDLLINEDGINEQHLPENLIVRVEPMYASVVKYFSKFENGQGKGRTEVKAPFTLPDGTVLCPTLWSGASRALSRKTAQHRVRIKFYTDTEVEALAAINELKNELTILLSGSWSPLDHPNYSYQQITGWKSWVTTDKFDQVISIFKDAADKYNALAESKHSKSSVWLGQEVTCRLLPNGILRLQKTHKQAKIEEVAVNKPVKISSLHRTKEKLIHAA